MRLATDVSRSAYRICPICEACCGLEVKVQADRVTTIRGWDGDVFSRGYVCPKGLALKDLHEDPDRLRRPLLKRDGHFEEVSWEEAFATIEHRLLSVIERHGRDAVALVMGNPSVHKMGLMLYLPRLVRALGSHNIYTAATLDQMPKQLASGLMFGHWLTVAVPDIDRCDFLLILGGNPVVSNGSMWTVPDFRGRARALRQRGGRIVVVDPRRTETAEIADEHLFIRPGGDVFLLLGMAHTLFEEKRLRLGRLADHVAGLDQAEAAVAAFSPERVATRCGVKAPTIRRLARELAAAPRAAIYGRMGTCTHSYGSTTSWLVDLLNVLTGHLDEAGGAMFAKAAAFAANTGGTPGRGKGIVTGRSHSRVSAAPEVFGEYPMGCLVEEIETPGSGQIRALVAIASNPVLSAPDGERLSRALDGLDFMVSLDIYLNETSRHADVILPGTSPLTDSHFDAAFPQLSCRNHARYSAAVLPGTPDSHPEWETLLRLTAIVSGSGAEADIGALDDALLADELRRKLGARGDEAFVVLAAHKGPERLVDLALRLGPYGDDFGAKPDGLTLAKVAARAGGIDLGPLEPRIPEVLRTPSGKIELAPRLVIDDLDRVAADLNGPAPQLVIIGRRQIPSNNSWMHNLPVLAKGPFRCTALVSFDDVARFGLVDGGKARLRTSSGSIDVVVECSDAMMPGVISLPHGWGHDQPGARLKLAERRAGANLNALFDPAQRDPLSGNATLSGVAVSIEAL